MFLDHPVQVAFRDQEVIHLTTLILPTFMLLSAKSYTNYFATFFYAMCLSVVSMSAGRRALLLFGLFGTVATLEPSLWFRWMQQHDLRLLWQSSLPTGMTRTEVILFLLCEITLLSFYVWYFLQTWKLLFEHAQPPITTAFSQEKRQ
jgi:hypothetical protein